MQTAIYEGYEHSIRHNGSLPFCRYDEAFLNPVPTTENTDSGVYDLAVAINSTDAAVCRVACEGHLGSYTISIADYLPHIYFHNTEQDSCVCGSPFHGFMGWLFTQKHTLDLSLKWHGSVFSRPDGGRWAVLSPQLGDLGFITMLLPIVRKFYWEKVFRPKFYRDVAQLTKFIQGYKLTQTTNDQED